MSTNTCRNCDKPTARTYCSSVCEDMDKHPAPRDIQQTLTTNSTHTYKRHWYSEDGTVLLIEGKEGLAISANETAGTVLVTNSRRTVILPSSDPLNLAVSLANIIFNTNKEYAS